MKGRYPAYLAALIGCALHLHFFKYFVGASTRAMGGRHLFPIDTFTLAQVAVEVLKLLGQLTASHLIPAAFLGYCCWSLLKPGPLPRWPARAAFVLVLATTLLAQKAQEFEPLSGDEFSHLFQSRILASGSLSLPGPALSDYFEMPFIQAAPWMGVYPPGWSCFLALFPLKLTFLGPVFISLLALAATYWLGRELYGQESARLAALLCALSPMFFWTGGSYFPHAFHFTTIGVAGAGFLAAQRRDSAWLAALAGLSLAGAFAVRPIETGLFSAVLVGWTGLHLRRLTIPWKQISLSLAALVVGLIAFGVWYRHIGGFYQSLALQRGTEHHMVAGLWNFWFSLARSLAWTTPFYLFLVVRGARGGGLKAGFLVLHVVATAAAFGAFIDNGQLEYGARYWFTAWFLLAPVAGRGARELLRDRAGSLAPLVALLICYNLCTLPASFQETGQRDFNLPRRWGELHKPPESLFFIRSAPGNNPLVMMRNLPFANQRWALFLEPDRNKALRRARPGQPAFVVDFRPQEGGFIFTPFEEADLDSDLSKMYAASNLGTCLGQRAEAVRVWRTIAAESPYYGVARLNCAQALIKLDRREEGEQELNRAQNAGIDPAQLERVRQMHPD